MARWRLPSAAVLALVALCPLVVAVDRGSSSRAPRQAHASIPAAAATLANAPLAFEANRGQTDDRVKYLTRGGGATLFLTGSESVLTLARDHHRATVVRTRLSGASSRARVTAERRLPGVVNVFKGPRSRWRTNIATFARVRYTGVYPGIDAVYYGRQGRLEYDFDVAPGADPTRIRIDIRGDRGLSIGSGGDLLVSLGAGTIRHLKPEAFQLVQGRRRPVDATWAIDRAGRAHFRLGPYDHGQRLVIDPVLAYSTFLGGSSLDSADTVAVGSDGSIFVGGVTASNDFPGSAGRPATRSDGDGYVTRINPSGTSIAYSTYFGSIAGDSVTDLVVDSSNRAVAVGTTLDGVGGVYDGGHFPVSGQVDGCQDLTNSAIVVRLTTSGAIDFATCLAGNGGDFANGVAVRDISGGTAIYVAGSTNSTTFNSTNAAQGPGGASDAFLVELDYTTSLSRTYSSYLGGTGGDVANGVALDSSGNAYLSGSTASTDFPGAGIAPGGPAAVYKDGWVAKFDTSQAGAATKSWALYFGGTGTDQVFGIDAAPDGTSYIVGKTNSPTLPGNATAGNLVRASGDDGFIAQITPDGTIPSSGQAPFGSTVFVGGAGGDASNAEELTDVAIRVQPGPSSNVTAIYAIGNTPSQLAEVNPVAVPGQQNSGQTCSNGNKQAMIVKTAMPAPSQSRAIYLTCLGGGSADSGRGVAIDPEGRPVYAGRTPGPWTTVNPLQQLSGGDVEGWIARFDQSPAVIDTGPSGIITTDSATFTFHGSDAQMLYKCTQAIANRLAAGHVVDCGIAGNAQYSNLDDGAHTFEAVTVDASFSRSAPVARTFTVDTEPPSTPALLEPADTAFVTASPTFKWNAATDSATTVDYELLIDGAKNQDVPGSSCSGGACQATSALTTGAHTWQVRALDHGGHVTDSASRTVTIIDPPTARMTISPNPALINRTVTLDGAASADASHTIGKYEWDLNGDGSFEVDTGATPTTTTTYPKSATIVVGLRVTDPTGTSGTTSSQLRITDPSIAGTQIGVSINKGAQYTNKADVSISIVAPAGATSILVSNDGGFASALPSPITKELSWKLDSSGPERLPKTVYLRFLTGTFASPNYTDDIILDETPPKVEQASVAPGVATGARAAKLKKWKLKVKARDSNSGVNSVQVTANKRKPGKALKYKTKLTVKLGSRPRFLRARDRAGNYSRWKKLR